MQLLWVGGRRGDEAPNVKLSQGAGFYGPVKCTLEGRAAGGCVFCVCLCVYM